MDYFLIVKIHVVLGGFSVVVAFVDFSSRGGYWRLVFLFVDFGSPVLRIFGVNKSTLITSDDSVESFISFEAYCTITA